MNSTYLKGLYAGEPYVSGEQPSHQVIKLNTNENPYPPATSVLKALNDFDGSLLRLYPKQDGNPLRNKLAKYHGVQEENIFVGNGSDEVIALAFRACFGLGAQAPVLFADITYSFYPVWCDFFGIPYETISVGEDFRQRAADYARVNGGIVICDPNAPTGISEGASFLEEILEANNGLSVVIVDEAYADFSDFTAVSKAIGTPNLLVIRSFSKSRSLAGMRIGYAIGEKRLISALNAAKDSFNSYPIDAVAVAAGAASLEDDKYFRDVVENIRNVRDDTAKRLRGLGFDVPDSYANFLFVGCGDSDNAKKIFEFLRSNDIYVRYFDYPRIADRLRISIGKQAEMDSLIKCLEEYLAL